MCPSSTPTLPSDSDLRRLLRFSSPDGCIWLAGQRMLLMHVDALQALRKEIIQRIGPKQARWLLMRAGHSAGERDGMLARQIRPHQSAFDAFAVGPQLHMLEGAVQVEAERFEYEMHADPAHSHFHGIFNWRNSWEAEVHRLEYGLQDEPACWMLLGYASGYSSAFFQQPVLFKERRCAACGHEHCQIEGRFLHEWPADEIDTDQQPPSVLNTIHALQEEVETLRGQLRQNSRKTGLVGQSPAFERAFLLLQQAAPTQVTVLLTGETGVGKEQFARALHMMSSRADKPFVAINCAALPAELIESELFGVEKGAYTGAVQARAGRFERADGGTLFLDELGELPLAAQAKLLRVVQQGEIEKLGGTEVRKVDVRIVAATNADLEKAVEAGAFRRDLLYRLNVYPIHIPSLRERPEDVPLLAQHMLRHYCAQHGKHIPGFTSQAITALRNHDWPGNVRELGNMVERGVIFTQPDQPIEVTSLFLQLAVPPSDRVAASGQLESADGQDAGTAPAGAAQLYQMLREQGLGLEELETMLLREAVEQAGGNLSAAARALKITRPQLSYRMARIGKRAEVPFGVNRP